MKTLHPKILELKKNAKPIEYSRSAVNTKGDLVDFRIAVDEKEERVVKGYLIVWGVVDTYRTVFVKGCCAKSINERGPESDAKQKILFHWFHKYDEPIGQFRVLKEDNYGLYFEAVVDEIPLGDRCLTQVNSGTINQFSIGFYYIWDKIVWDEETEVSRLLEIDLFEGSAVSRGSNAETFALRSPEDLEAAKEQLTDDINEFIRTLPKTKRLELREILHRQITLAKAEPGNLEPLHAERKPGKENVSSSGLSKLQFNF